MATQTEAMDCLPSNKSNNVRALSPKSSQKRFAHIEKRAASENSSRSEQGGSQILGKRQRSSPQKEKPPTEESGSQMEEPQKH
jgi:hypothetical protein